MDTDFTDVAPNTQGTFIIIIITIILLRLLVIKIILFFPQKYKYFWTRKQRLKVIQLLQ